MFNQVSHPFMPVYTPLIQPKTVNTGKIVVILIISIIIGLKMYMSYKIWKESEIKKT